MSSKVMDDSEELHLLFGEDNGRQAGPRWYHYVVASLAVMASFILGTAAILTLLSAAKGWVFWWWDVVISVAIGAGLANCTAEHFRGRFKKLREQQQQQPPTKLVVRLPPISSPQWRVWEKK